MPYYIRLSLQDIITKSTVIVFGKSHNIPIKKFQTLAEFFRIRIQGIVVAVNIKIMARADYVFKITSVCVTPHILFYARINLYFILKLLFAL